MPPPRRAGRGRAAGRWGTRSPPHPNAVDTEPQTLLTTGPHTRGPACRPPHSRAGWEVTGGFRVEGAQPSPDTHGAHTGPRSVGQGQPGRPGESPRLLSRLQVTSTRCAGSTNGARRGVRPGRGLGVTVQQAGRAGRGAGSVSRLPSGLFHLEIQGHAGSWPWRRELRKGLNPAFKKEGGETLDAPSGAQPRGCWFCFSVKSGLRQRPASHKVVLPIYLN